MHSSDRIENELTQWMTTRLCTSAQARRFAKGRPQEDCCDVETFPEMVVGSATPGQKLLNALTSGIRTMTNSVADIPDEKLLERAVRNAKPRKGRVPKWSAVADTFGIGSTYSIQLCRRFDIDPDQQVGRNGAVR